MKIINKIKQRLKRVFHKCDWETLETAKDSNTPGLPEGYRWRKIGRARCRVCGDEKMLF